MILRVEISYVVSLIDLFFQLTVSPPEKERMTLEKGPISIRKKDHHLQKKKLQFSVDLLQGLRVTHQDCRIA